MKGASCPSSSPRIRSRTNSPGSPFCRISITPPSFWQPKGSAVRSHNPNGKMFHNSPGIPELRLVLARRDIREKPSRCTVRRSQTSNQRRVGGDPKLNLPRDYAEDRSVQGVLPCTRQSDWCQGPASWHSPQTPATEFPLRRDNMRRNSPSRMSYFGPTAFPSTETSARDAGLQEVTTVIVPSEKHQRTCGDPEWSEGPDKRQSGRSIWVRGLRKTTAALQPNWGYLINLNSHPVIHNKRGSEM